MRRREFITLLGGSMGLPSLLRTSAAQAQESRPRRIGWLSGGTESDSGWLLQRAALLEGLAKLGWVQGRNLQIEFRFGAADPDRLRTYAAELVRFAPAVIVTSQTAATVAVQRQTKTIPIVFTAQGDPVANGMLQNVSRPEGNITGFSTPEPSIAGKWLALLKEAAPHISRVGVLFDPEVGVTSPSYIAAIDAAAPTLSVEVVKTPVHDAVDVVHALDAFAATPNGGLLVLLVARPVTLEPTVRLARQHQMPAIYQNWTSTAAGGLMSYGVDIAEQSRRAATYVDRILRGAKINDLPVQFPTKFELVVNLKTAKAIGLTIPEAFLLRADEVIE